MLLAQIRDYLERKSTQMPLWLSHENVNSFILLVSDVLTTADEKELARKIVEATGLPETHIQFVSQHWTKESLDELLQHRKPEFMLIFGESLGKLLRLEISPSWQKQIFSSLELQVYLAPPLAILKTSAKEKKNLWSVLKKAKYQIADSY